MRIARGRSRLVWLATLLAPAVWIACGIDLVGGGDAIGEPDGGEDSTPAADAPASRADADAPDAVSEPDAGVDAGIVCPNDGGASMIALGSFCIDATEVTEAQYAVFLAANEKVGSGGPPACAWKTSYVPGMEKQVCRWDPAKYPNLPVVCVDWCDAEAYCRWAGKRLCGAIGGGAIPWTGTAYKDPRIDAWYSACSKAGTQRYPYGDTFHTNACSVKELDLRAVIDAGALTSCLGGYTGLYDMVGNAWEHEDSCTPDAGDAGKDAGPEGKRDYCRLRGGSWAHDDAFGNCEAYGAENRRSDRFDDVGFRCCAP